MKLLFVNSAREWGGTEKWTRMATRKLSEQHEVSLIYRKEVVGKNFDLPKFRLPCLSHIDLYTLLRMVAIIRQNGIEVVIPTKRKDYLLGGLAGKITGVPMILRLGADRKLKWPWQRFMYHTLSSGIIVNASKIKKTLLETGYIPEAKIRVIYNGLDTAELDRRRSEQPVANPFPVTITGLGRLTWNKGYDFLIRSFARFVKHTGNRDAGIVLIGDGAQKEEFTKLAAELGLRERVLFPGFQQNPYPWLAASDIFAVTSTNEGLPNALLEAMYLGNAPVSTRAGGVEEVIDDSLNGLLLDYGDEEALSSALQLLVESPERRAEFARQAKARIIEQFSMERMASEIAGFCREVAGKR
ncbi:glycosyltransferase [Chlorobaculum sp. MV4-Y]|jgi:glycosyltransferase involved in cell wall biosynthesis|uniref:glycosyltransferase n=1 Tax=unclassified Chlorobaculum TaxID=2685250 RepID=UPI00100BCAF4|nr:MULTISPECIES: glycosyltransferase [unclassified Chlorobaculum]RXK88717.1 glycosyltransferase [Chlorobaculum sp. 24CR]UWX57862.1 glycosyltransferase [Chlorobaculum sp. MV4-Y]